MVNDDDLTYAKIRLDPESLATVLAGLPTVTSALTRAVLWGGCGTPAATPSCRPPTTSTWCSAAWPPRPTPRPCAPCSARRALPRTATPRRPAGRSSPRPGPQGWPTCWPRRPPARTCSWRWPGPSPPRPNPGWAARPAARLVVGTAGSGRVWSSMPTCAGCWWPTCPGWAGRRGRHRRRAGAGPVDHRIRAGGRGPRRPADRRGQGGGVAAGGGGRRHHQHRPARHLPVVLVTRPGRRAAALRRPLLRRGRGHLRAARGLGRQGRVAAEERAAQAVPLADGQAGAAGPAGPLAGRRAAVGLRCAGSSTSDATTWCERCAARPAGEADRACRSPSRSTRAVRRRGAAQLPGQADHRRRGDVRGGRRRAALRPDPPLPHGPGIIELAWTGRSLRAHPDRRADRDRGRRDVARLCDTRAPAPAIADHLGRPTRFGALVAAAPACGFRAPSIRHELAFRALIGQQISLAAAATCAAKLAAAYGEAVDLARPRAAPAVPDRRRAGRGGPGRAADAARPRAGPWSGWPARWPTARST